MANLITSIGYSLGKLHSGMIAYLCELHREGTTRPLQTFFDALEVSVPVRPVALREWNSVDLAIVDEEDGIGSCPRILVEMKVDDHEHWTTKGKSGGRTPGYQTTVYADSHPGCSAYLYVTAGMGEYYRAPSCARFRWIRIRRILEALDHMEGEDQALRDWRDAIRNEVDLQDRVLQNDRSRINQYRSGAWNVYFLGHLKESLQERCDCAREATCYPWGAAPDTILHFGRHPDVAPAYLEINSNGRLNLKVSLYMRETEDEKARLVQTLRDLVTTAYQGTSVRLHGAKCSGKSKTVASFDIALESIDGALQFARSQEETLLRLQEIVPQFLAGSVRTGSHPAPAGR